MASLPASTASTVYSEAGAVAGRYGVDADDLAHRVIEKFIDHRRSCSRNSCSTCDGQIDTRFVRRSLKNEAIDIRNELKMRGQRETDAARPELSTSSDPAIVIEADETEELLKHTASDLARLRAHDRGWYDAFLLHSLGRSHREIAEILSLSIANSQQQVSRARKYLSSLRRAATVDDACRRHPRRRARRYGVRLVASPFIPVDPLRASPCRLCHCPPKTFRGWSCRSRILSARRFPTVRSMKARNRNDSNVFDPAQSTVPPGRFRARAVSADREPARSRRRGP